MNNERGEKTNILKFADDYLTLYRAFKSHTPIFSKFRNKSEI